MKFIIFVLLFISASAEKARFDNYRVYSVKVENEQQYNALRYLEDHSDSYEFWESPALNGEAEILVPPHMFAHFGEISETLNLKTALHISNLQELIDEESKPSRNRRIEGQMDWESYKTLDEINAWIDEIVAAHNTVARISTVGTTIQGRPIRMVSISKKSGNRGIFIEANIHAREWISSATATYLINELLTSTDPGIVDIATNVDWHIITNANPDGFVFTKESNRNWRKSRAPVSALCFGVDNNRNFAHNWLIPDETGNEGASRTPCTDTYAGPRPHSENETLAIESVLQQYHSTLDMFLSFHSYGHWMLHPWGTTRVPASNAATLGAVGTAFRDGVFAVDGINYAVGSSNALLYAASGTSPDHAYGYYNIPLSYTIEMRGNGAYGNYGFVLPPQFILPNAIEVTAGLVKMIQTARTYGFF